MYIIITHLCSCCVIKIFKLLFMEIKNKSYRFNFSVKLYVFWKFKYTLHSLNKAEAPQPEALITPDKNLYFAGDSYWNQLSVWCVTLSVTDHDNEHVPKCQLLCSLSNWLLISWWMNASATIKAPLHVLNKDQSLQSLFHQWAKNGAVFKPRSQTTSSSSYL